jgi:hypothetical protein
MQVTDINGNIYGFLGLEITGPDGKPKTTSGGGVITVTATSPIASTGGTTPDISISQATTSTNGYLSSTDWNTFNGKQNALARYASATDGTPVSSTTTITLTSSQLIPANTFTVNNVIRVYVRFIKSTANANTSFYIYINTSASLTGATQLGILTTNNRTNGVKRDMYIKSATSTQVYPATLGTPTDDVVQSNAASSINIDWTTDKYIIFAIGHTGATDTGGLTSGYTIEKYA